MEPDRIVLEDVKIIFLNFTGREGPYNQEGDRNFVVLLDDKTAVGLTEAGWNVKHLEPREEGDTPQPYLQVSVKYVKRNGQKVAKPPRIVMISPTTKSRTALDERTVELLDSVDILTADMILRPSYWEMNGKTGIKAYLDSLFVTIDEDPLQKKYAEYDEE